MASYFEYLSYRLSDDRQTVYFDYRQTEDGASYNFTETLEFPLPLPDSGALANGLRALHIALGISYYKIFVSPDIRLPYALDQAEADFWNTVWRGGLGEFLYINQLAPDRLAGFSAQDGQPLAAIAAVDLGGALLGIGGGKDSIVAGELLKNCGLPVDGFVMATGAHLGQAQQVTDIMSVPLHGVKRQLDLSLITLQQQPGRYRGHIPISLIFGLVGTVLALALGKEYVVVANESSASIPRASWEHGEVNHQWSKSLESERLLQHYIHSTITPSVTYFSAVRQLSSVAIMKLFARHRQYFNVFTSDNSVFRIDAAARPETRWSLESPKSLSSFILLAPWVDEATLLETFQRDFLDQPELEQLFLEIIGLSGHQPLDCVGTVDELRLSLQLAQRQGKFAASALMKLAAERGLLADAESDTLLSAMLQLSPNHALPAGLTGRLPAEISQELA